MFTCPLLNKYYSGTNGKKISKANQAKLNKFVNGEYNVTNHSMMKNILHHIAQYMPRDIELFDYFVENGVDINAISGNKNFISEHWSDVLECAVNNGLYGDINLVNHILHHPKFIKTPEKLNKAISTIKLKNYSLDEDKDLVELQEYTAEQILDLLIQEGGMLTVDYVLQYACCMKYINVLCSQPGFNLANHVFELVKKMAYFPKYAIELINREPNANYKALDIYNDNIFMHICYFNDEIDDLINILVDKGVDVNNINIRNESPLHHFIRYGAKSAVKTIIQRGADVNLLNLEWKSYLAKLMQS